MSWYNIQCLNYYCDFIWNTDKINLAKYLFFLKKLLDSLKTNLHKTKVLRNT